MSRPPCLRENVPQGTKSFAVTAYDPDAPTGSGFWHWVAYNIPASLTGLTAGAGNPANTPDIKHASSDFGARLRRLLPARGDIPHRYIFTLHALSCDDRA